MYGVGADIFSNRENARFLAAIKARVREMSRCTYLKGRAPCRSHDTFDDKGGRHWSMGHLVLPPGFDMSPFLSHGRQSPGLCGACCRFHLPCDRVGVERYARGFDPLNFNRMGIRSRWCGDVDTEERASKLQSIILPLSGRERLCSSRVESSRVASRSVSSSVCLLASFVV